MIMATVFTGRGNAYPMRVDHTGGLALNGEHDVISDSIRLILGTSPGERPMRPGFGCPIHELMFEPADATTRGLVAFEVERSLRRTQV